MKRSQLFLFLAIVAGLSVLDLGLSGCGIYSFKEKYVSKDSSRTVRINFIENRAPYVNPQLSPSLTERLRLKISNQTKLTQTNNGSADIDISGTITDYSVSTAGVTTTNGQQQSSINRLTVSVRVNLNRRISAQTEEFSVSRSFDFGAGQSLQSAESTLLAEMVRNLSDEIFNRIFSTW
jgi:hypothetical protein